MRGMYAFKWVSIYEQGFRLWPFRLESGTPTHGDRGGRTSIPWTTELLLEQMDIKGTLSWLQQLGIKGPSSRLQQVGVGAMQMPVQQVGFGAPFSTTQLSWDVGQRLQMVYDGQMARLEMGYARDARAGILKGNQMVEVGMARNAGVET